MRRHPPRWEPNPDPRVCTEKEQLQELASYVQEVSEVGVEFSNSVDAFLGGGFKYVLFSPLLGEDSQFD